MHMHKKKPQINSKQRQPAPDRLDAAPDGGASTIGKSRSAGAGRRGQAVGTSGNGIDPPAGGDQDLLLWALANGLEPEGGWFRSVQLSRRDLAALSHAHQARFEQLRRMKEIGKLVVPEQLAVLLRARLLQMLLAATGPKELAEGLRVFEKLPATSARSTTDSGADAALDPQLDEDELRQTMAEARRLLRELESDPAVRRLIGDPRNGNGEEPQC